MKIKKKSRYYYPVLLLFIYQLCVSGYYFKGYSANTFFTFISSQGHHRGRRSVSYSNTTVVCNDNDLPQPTIDYPLVLFENLNYNDCFKTGKYIRIRANDFVKYAHNKPAPDRGKIMMWNSMIMFPGVNVSFRGCCPSGNNFVSSVSNWTQKTGNINASVQLDSKVSEYDGIWYKDWLYWQTSFHLMVSEPKDTSMVQSCGTCKFEQCGITGKCECLPGFSGSSCEVSPSSSSYPTEQYPLLLFKGVSFTGSIKYLTPGEILRFAVNEVGDHGGRKVYYNSMRVYFNRTIVFQREDSHGNSVWSPANDVHDMAEFFDSNPHFGDPIWYNFDRQILIYFTIKVL